MYVQQSSFIWSHRALPFSFFYFFLCQSTPTAVRHGNLIAIFWPIYLFLIPFTEEGGLFKHAHAALPKILSTLLPKTNLWICWIKISDHYASQNLSRRDQNDHLRALRCFNFDLFISWNLLKIEWKLNQNRRQLNRNKRETGAGQLRMPGLYISIIYGQNTGVLEETPSTNHSLSLSLFHSIFIRFPFKIHLLI